MNHRDKIYNEIKELINRINSDKQEFTMTKEQNQELQKFAEEWSKCMYDYIGYGIKQDNKKLDRWWVSWCGTGIEFTLYSPWWISGFKIDDIPIICAAIIAENEEEVKKIIVEAHDEAVVPEWRFIDMCKEDWHPFSERFPRADWMEWPE